MIKHRPSDQVTRRYEDEEHRPHRRSASDEEAESVECIKWNDEATRVRALGIARNILYNSQPYMRPQDRSELETRESQEAFNTEVTASPRTHVPGKRTFSDIILPEDVAEIQRLEAREIRRVNLIKREGHPGQLATVTEITASAADETAPAQQVEVEVHNVA